MEGRTDKRIGRKAQPISGSFLPPLKRRHIISASRRPRIATPHGKDALSFFCGLLAHVQTDDRRRSQFSRFNARSGSVTVSYRTRGLLTKGSLLVWALHSLKMRAKRSEVKRQHDANDLGRFGRMQQRRRRRLRRQAMGRQANRVSRAVKGLRRWSSPERVGVNLRLAPRE
jgi:hypothetical protein